MKHSLTLLFAMGLLLSCEKHDEAPPALRYFVEPTAYMTAAGQEDFLYSISRYICHYPNQANEANKWEPRFDESYLEQSRRYTLSAYYTDSLSGRHYYMVSRIAPSIYVKYVALAGTFVPRHEDPLGDYEEVFRTWKMLAEEHKEKSEMLFQKFVQGADLTRYQIQNTAPVEYIEFPDPETWYDKKDRVWRTSRGDILAPYRIW